ncbi:unnamed protein product [Larinioides sclopetarius]|uniref:Uncharacterized protein n=1 Tax=Larinioides sclopetarius TaxID=280406 RepID=A0AAV2BTM0_9ARAC
MELFTTDKLLGSENWARWKWMAEGLLMEKENAYEVCSGDIVKPEPVPEDATTEARKKYDRDLASFNKGNRAARGIFSRTLDSRICDLVSMCKTAREIWVKLHELFEQRNKQAQYACQLQFSSFIRDPANSMAMHIASLERLVSRMTDLDIKPNDFVIMSKLLETLSRDFEPLKMSWCARPEEQQTLVISEDFEADLQVNDEQFLKKSDQHFFLKSLCLQKRKSTRKAEDGSFWGIK